MKMPVYKLSNRNGVEVEFISQGGKIMAVRLPDGKEKVDIVLGYATPEAYVTGDIYLGAICGRFANRIGGGKFPLEGKTVQLTQNFNQRHHLHGGFLGFNVKEWDVHPVILEGYTSAYRLSLTSPDGEENYPGTLRVDVGYALNDHNELLIDLRATTDKTTIVNLTSHPYFNLNGKAEQPILNHLLEINADRFTMLDEDAVTTGELRNVAHTDMDFLQPQKLADIINGTPNDGEKKWIGKGIDYNWVLNKPPHELSFAARLTEPESGRAVELYTTLPGMQVYTALHFDGTEIDKRGVPIRAYSGIAMEAQQLPNAPNHPHFPSPILHPGETYHQKIIYRFLF